jgi:hypothetical protein
MYVAFRCMNRDTIDRTISRFVEWKHTSHMRGIITCMQNMEVPLDDKHLGSSGKLHRLYDLPEVVQEIKLSRLTFHLHLRLLATFRSELRSEPVNILVRARSRLSPCQSLLISASPNSAMLAATTKTKLRPSVTSYNPYLDLVPFRQQSACITRKHQKWQDHNTRLQITKFGSVDGGLYSVHSLKGLLHITGTIAKWEL